MSTKLYADFDFSGPAKPGLPPIGVSESDERFAPWEVFVHTEASNAPGVYRVVCALAGERDVFGRRPLMESTVMVLDQTGAEVTRRINLHVKDV